MKDGRYDYLNLRLNESVQFSVQLEKNNNKDFEISAIDISFCHLSYPYERFDKF